MTTEDINQITAAVIAQLRQGATDLDGIKASSALADTDNVIAANGSTVKKLPVSLFKKIVASGTTVYRLMVSGQTFKADTTAVLVGVTKSEGGKIEQLTALPKGWRIKVEWKGSASAMSNVLSAPGTINPNAATGSTSVEITLYDGDPTTDQTAQAIDEATLLLVSDGKNGKDGATGVKGDKGDTGDLQNFPIESVDSMELADIYPNRIYKATAPVTAVSVATVHYSDGSDGYDFSAHGELADEYVLDFTAGASCAVGLPEELMWNAIPTFHEGKRYVISIIDNLAVVAEFTAL